VLLMINRQPGANIIETVDRVRALLPLLRASCRRPSTWTWSDRTVTIRASLREVERTLVISVALVMMVVFLFLRNGAPRSSPAWWCRCRWPAPSRSCTCRLQPQQPVADGPDHRHRLRGGRRHRGAGEHRAPHRAGMRPFDAALRGAREVGFTVLSMSLSLIAVFIPILLMGGIVGRLFREFAVVLSAAILVSMVVSLTTTPMMCARLLRPRPPEAERGRVDRAIGRALAALLEGYRRTLGWALAHRWIVLLVLAATVGLNVHLYQTIPKGFFPQQDTGRLRGFVEADQAISFQAMKEKMDSFLAIVGADPAVATVTGFTGGSQRNYGSMFVTLKPIAERKESADAVVGRLRKKLARVPGANLYLSPCRTSGLAGARAIRPTSSPCSPTAWRSCACGSRASATP
jgi:multidrug efflux pump